MMPIARRALLAGMGATPVCYVPFALAVDALPDARFVGFSQAVNDFEINSGQLALTKSANQNVRGYATRAISEHTSAASSLRKASSEAGVAYAPDSVVGPTAATTMTYLKSLQGAEFDTAFANAQVAIQTAAVDQFGAYSQNGKSGPLRRYAQLMLPTSKMFLDYARSLAGGR